MRDKLARAIALAAWVHHDQRDKAGESYILHPIAVMQIADKILDDGCQRGTAFEPGLRQDVLVCAVLHDVIEAGPETVANTIQDAYGDRVFAALDALTRRRDEDYREYIYRLSQNSIARIVKLADLKHNMEISRMAKSNRDVKRSLFDKISIYIWAYRFLQDKV